MRAARATTRPRRSLRQKSRASLAMAADVLALSRGELAERIEAELAENPALELTPQQLCALCGATTREEVCASCRASLQLWQWSTAFEREGSREYLGFDGDFEGDPFGQVQTPMDLRSYLTLQARGALGREDQAIADYVIANINDKGLLECGAEEIGEVTGAPRERVEAVLAAVRQFEPAGVGAATPREALLIQLDQLGEAGRGDPLARRIVAEHWEALARHAHTKIARALGVEREQVEASVTFIQRNLNPYPGQQFYSPWQGGASRAGGASAPDVVIRRELDEYRVEIASSAEGELRVSDSYARLQRLAAERPARETPAAWRAALEAVRRARWFLSCLRMREETLRRIAECLVERQRGYLDTGEEERLRPLTQAAVAELTGKHESTVSRAIAGKAALTPWGEVVPLARFFDASAAPKSIIRELVEREDRSRPLSDSELRSLLEARGFELARRTVTKYRLALDIPSHGQRRLGYQRAS